MEKTKEVYYSINEEEYRYSEIEEAQEMAWDDTEADSETITIWQGDCHLMPASHYAPDVLEYMGERAYDENSEYGMDWPDLKAEDAQGL